MNAYDPDLFAATSPCITCCPPTESCLCAMTCPVSTGPGSISVVPAADYAAATAVVSDNTVGCLMYFTGEGDTPGASSATFDGTTLAASFTSTNTSPTPEIGISETFSISLLSGSAVSIVFTSSGDADLLQTLAILYKCEDGSQVDQDISSDPSGTLTLTAPADGTYFLRISGGQIEGESAPTTATLDISATCDDIWYVNPVIVMWDDSGTTRQLEACPKMLLPPLTESTGDWYADCAAADAVLTDSSSVASCIAYAEGFRDSLSASGGSSLAITVGASGGAPGLGPVYGSINAVAGDTLNFSTTGGGSVFAFNIYDDTGTLIDSVSSGSSSWTSSALPYTGRYTVTASTSLGGPMTSFSVTVTSSGTMSTNPIQARYDVGLTCAALLDCGDSCP